MPTSKYNPKQPLTTLAIQLKHQMNDIIDVAYKTQSPEILSQLKRFTFHCSADELKTRLGDCRWDYQNKTSKIRIFAMGKEGFRETLITAMHEVSHHIDMSLRGKSGHDKEFYAIHKKLLFAAMDMGIIQNEDVINSTSIARNRDKLAQMMSEYIPNETSYKPNIVQVFVYNSYEVKDQLKERGYRWNALEKAWFREVTTENLPLEKETLQALKIPPRDITIIESCAVIAHFRKTVHLYNVPFDSNPLVKSLGYKWTQTTPTPCWTKKIDTDTIPLEEVDQLAAIPNLKIAIT